MDGPVLAWTLLIAVGAAVFFGLAPGLRISSGNLQEILKDSGQGLSAGRKHDRMRSALVITEVALAFVLLVGAGLLLRSFLRVLDVDLGFEPSRAAAIGVDYDDGGNAAKRTAIWQEVVRRASLIPGVEGAGISDNLPMSRNRSWGIKAKGGDYDGGKFQGVFVYIVSPGYLKSMGMRLVEGRDIDWADLSDNQNVVIVNETVARKLWPGQDPIGRIALAGGTESRVIGVIADVRETSAEDDAGWQMYLPATKRFGPEGCYLVVRSKLPPRCAGSEREEDASSDQSRAAGDRVQTDSESCGPCDIATALLLPPGVAVRWTWVTSGYLGNLRSHFLFGYARDAADRHPHGPGSDAGTRVVWRHPKDRAARARSELALG